MKHAREALQVYLFDPVKDASRVRVLQGVLAAHPALFRGVLRYPEALAGKPSSSHSCRARKAKQSLCVGRYNLEC